MNVEFKARGTRGEIWLYDVIGADMWSGGGISADMFRRELTALGRVSTINLHINSPGGDVFDGFSMYSLLQQHAARIEVDIDGMAASIASIIAMAGDEIRIAKNAMMMIHNPRTMVAGGEDDLMRRVEQLRAVKGNLSDTYAGRTGNGKDQVLAWMKDETWFTAGAAVEYGFANAVTADTGITACLEDMRDFHNVPAALKQRLQASVRQPLLDLRRQRIATQQQRVAALHRT